MSDKLTRHQTKARHVKLHRRLDELVACFIAETGHTPSQITLLEFMQWSHEMTKNPTCVDKDPSP
jgi:hypothetical protein